MKDFTEGDEVLFTFVEGVSILTSKVYDGEIAKILFINHDDEHPYTIKFSDGVVDCVTTQEVKDPDEDDPTKLGTRY